MRAAGIVRGALAIASAPQPALVPATAPRILDAVRQPGARAVLVDVWATWCQPCREEFPDLIRLYRAYRDHGLRLILVDADFAQDRAAAARFLAAQGVDFPTYAKDGPDMEFIDGLEPSWTGTLPATFFYDSKGALRAAWQGRTDYATLERKVLEVMGSKERGQE